MKLPGFYCTKIGMTQIFDEATRKVIPTTAVRVGSWVVLQVKNIKQDGYCALQVGLPKPRFANSSDFEAMAKEYPLTDKFLFVREVRFDATADMDVFSFGQVVTLSDLGVNVGDVVKVSGMSKGLGFQGVMRRHGFGGGPASHGSDFHRIPGSVGCIRGKAGKIIKGKKLPGHMGHDMTTIKGLKIVDADEATSTLFIKGALPGKKGTLLLVRGGV